MDISFALAENGPASADGSSLRCLLSPTMLTGRPNRKNEVVTLLRLKTRGPRMIVCSLAVQNVSA